jgi:hypothetical protein
MGMRPGIRKVFFLSVLVLTLLALACSLSQVSPGPASKPANLVSGSGPIGGQIPMSLIISVV